jgi:hypothetical protein
MLLLLLLLLQRIAGSVQARYFHQQQKNSISKTPTLHMFKKSPMAIATKANISNKF